MRARGKKYQAARQQVSDRLHSIEEAVPLLQQVKFTKFDETVEIAVRLGVNPKHSDQMVRGTVVLPHGLGKSKRVLVIANPEKQREAQEAGADEIGGDEIVEKITGGWMAFDAVVATPDMMRVVGRLGKVLGPRGLMPNPRVGTVAMDVAQAITDAKGGQVQFRVEKAGVVHAGVGKASFDEGKLVENVRAMVEAINRARPTGAKGTYLKKVSISSTMGAGISIALDSLSA